MPLARMSYVVFPRSTSRPGRLVVRFVIAAASCALWTLAVADIPNPAPVALFTAMEETTPPAGAWQAWRVEINHAEIRQPAAAIRVSIPGLPEFVREVSFWSPREGYIDAPNPKHPLGLQQIPDPTAPPEAFSWRWAAPNLLFPPNGISLTVHQGIAAGTISHGARWFYISPRADHTLLYEPSGSVGPPPPPRPVPGLATPGVILLSALLLGWGGCTQVTSRAGADATCH